MFTSNILKAKTTDYLYRLLTDESTVLLGVSCTSEGVPGNTLYSPYLTNLEYEKGVQFNFDIELYINDNQKTDIRQFNSNIHESGLGYINTSKLFTPGLNGLAVDTIMQDTSLSSTNKLVLENTFVDPSIKSTLITLSKDVKVQLVKIEEQSVLTDLKHEVWLLLSEKQYDGQTLLGMLEDKELNKTHTRNLLDMVTGNQKIINKEIPCVYLEADYTSTLYNTNKTGIFLTESATTGKLSIACGQSVLSIPKKDIKGSKLIRVNVDKYEWVITLQKGHSLTIFI